ncbi:hypothetical protein AOR_1_1484164 [Paecilomyces variotii No. 5]|uniref:Tat pathway signal sequence n=1 Tax=Byssochlamys spectabilis (strain No. 5 / NBRC 109023) TaxID=1356009 RepID=V5FTM8_BYSSN|nr:hypothetical protein AOR_1_1484164 [Paecilomyces variotii No. 5]
MKIMDSLFGQRYDKISEEPAEEGEVDTPKSKSRPYNIIIYSLAGAALWFFGLVIGVIGARYFLTSGHCSSSPALSGTIPKIPLSHWTKQHVHHDTAFEAAPPPSGPESVWNDIIPNGLGYIKHPELAPEFSVIGVFHQLHCLYLVRRAYYSTASGNEDFDFNIDRAPHVGHCFDYLRQSLMCAADANLEPATQKINNNPDWGFDRQCRSYEEVKNWAEQWRVFDAHGFIPHDLLPAHNQSHAESET